MNTWNRIYILKSFKVFLQPYQWADGARLPLQEEASQVEHDEHHMVVQQGGVHLVDVQFS